CKLNIDLVSLIVIIPNVFASCICVSSLSPTSTVSPGLFFNVFRINLKISLSGSLFSLYEQIQQLKYLSNSYFFKILNIFSSWLTIIPILKFLKRISKVDIASSYGYKKCFSANSIDG